MRFPGFAGSDAPRAVFPTIGGSAPRSSLTVAVACIFLVLLVMTHCAVFPTIAFTQNGEVCTVDASVAEQFFLENLYIISTRPCILQSFQQSAGSARWVFGALDDEEFFIVEGSGGGGVAGSLTPR